MISWWKILDLNEFESLGVPDYYFSKTLNGLGLVDFIVMKGFGISVIFQGYVLTPRLNNRNGFSVADKYIAYIDKDNNLWVGMKNENNL